MGFRFDNKFIEDEVKKCVNTHEKELKLLFKDFKQVSAITSERVYNLELAIKDLKEVYPALITYDEKKSNNEEYLYASCERNDLVSRNVYINSIINDSFNNGLNIHKISVVQAYNSLLSELNVLIALYKKNYQEMKAISKLDRQALTEEQLQILENHQTLKKQINLKNQMFKVIKFEYLDSVYRNDLLKYYGGKSQAIELGKALLN